MQKALGAALAILLATSAIGTNATAAPRQFDRQDRFIQNYCSNHQDNDCRDWKQNRNRWSVSRYDRWYRDHNRRHDFGPANAAATIFGLAAGAIGNAIATGATSSHAAACAARYRSYDRHTDTVLGLHGQRHRCRL